MLVILYVFATIIHGAIIADIWIDKMCECDCCTKKDFISLFRVYDLTLIFFPISLTLVLIMIGIFIFENIDMGSLFRDSFWNKRLFK